MPLQNRVSNGSRPRMGNLGRVKAVTSNRERTLWLSQLGLLFYTGVEAILPHRRRPKLTMRGVILLFLLVRERSAKRDMGHILNNYWMRLSMIS